RGLPIEDHALRDLADALTASIVADPRIYRAEARFIPDRAAIASILERLDWVIYPGFFGAREVARAQLRGHIGDVLEDLARRLFDQLSAAFRYEQSPDAGTARFEESCEVSDRRAASVLRTFLAVLPNIRRMLS